MTRLGALGHAVSLSHVPWLLDLWLSSHFAGGPHFTTTNVMPLQRNCGEADSPYENLAWDAMCEASCRRCVATFNKSCIAVLFT
jgi:hypothetical protein